MVFVSIDVCSLVYLRIPNIMKKQSGYIISTPALI